MRGSCTLIEHLDLEDDIDPEPDFDQGIDIAERAAWLKTFTVQRKIIEQGIRDNLPLTDRATRLTQAEAVLPVEGLEDMRHLDVIAGMLEDKLTEMLDVAQGRARGKLAAMRLPPDFKSDPSWDELRRPACRAERRWLFIGGMQEILHHYRDSGQVLILEERDRLLKQLTSSINHLRTTIDQLDSHLVVALALSDGDRAQIAQFRALAPAIDTLYKSALGAASETDLQALLENSFNRFRVQFLATSAQLCLKLYGNVSIFHLRELWLLKSMYPLLPPEADPATLLESLADADRQRFQRSISGAINRLCKQAERDAAPIWPILQIYRFNPRYGRDLVKKRVAQASEGLASAAPPTDDFGASWIPGI